MPCGHFDETRPRVIYDPSINNALEAMLCHAFTVAEQQILNAPLEVYLECGTKRVDMQAWWDSHKAEDERRRALEQEEKKLIEQAQNVEAQRQRDAEERKRVLDAMTPEARRLFEK
jgi:hypothetical protein